MLRRNFKLCYEKCESGLSEEIQNVIKKSCMLRCQLKSIERTRNACDVANKYLELQDTVAPDTLPTADQPGVPH